MLTPIASPLQRPDAERYAKRFQPPPRTSPPRAAALCGGRRGGRCGWIGLRAVAWRRRRLRLAQRIRCRTGPAVKRLADLVAAAALLALLAPLLAAIAAGVKLYDRGPILFWQRRVGRRGRRFDCPKFRSMVVDAEAQRGALEALNHHGDGEVTFKIKRDPRVTPIGRALRKLSLDELPQLWCVLRGQMSLVGPRPAVPDEVERYTAAERRRLEAVPGLTCIWQVSGRGDIPFAEQVRMDIDYIERQGLWLDLKLLLLTLPAVITGKGAY